MQDYDAIVIGSGIGGMTAAGLLAGVAHKRVLVLEKYTEPVRPWAPRDFR